MSSLTEAAEDVLQLRLNQLTAQHLVQKAVLEFWGKLLDATQQSCSGIYEWVEEL